MVLQGANGQSLGRVGGVVGVMAIFRQLRSWNPHAFHKRATHTLVSVKFTNLLEKALARPASVERVESMPPSRLNPPKSIKPL